MYGLGVYGLGLAEAVADLLGIGIGFIRTGAGLVGVGLLGVGLAGAGLAGAGLAGVDLGALGAGFGEVAVLLPGVF